ncbi:MAG: hypothetical protein ACXABO_16745 [Promethearchaeota archaeon]|jgi:hypothetical protein
MNKSINRSKKGKVRGLNQNFNFSAPPYDMFSAYQPGGYSRMYHRVEAERMKRSYNWVYSEYEANKSINIMDTIEIEIEIPPMTSLKKGRKLLL